MSFEKVSNFIERCLSFAENNSSCLPSSILNINGMSSNKVRHLLNNLCSRPTTSYLEIGTWRGSTLISSVYGNHAKAVAIDNFSQFTLPHPKTNQWLFLTEEEKRQKAIHPKEELHQNLIEFAKDKDITIIDGDCQDKKIIEKVSTFNKFDVYFYDGDHSYESQKNGIINYMPFLEKHAIIIVDDWNASDASLGTFDALKECGKKIKYLKELKSNHNCDRSGYWNGIGIIVCE